MRQQRECKDCGAPIFFLDVETRKGVKRMPINWDPDPRGNIGIYLSKDLGAMIPRGSDWVGERYTSHFSNCPQAAEWRERGKRRAVQLAMGEQ